MMRTIRVMGGNAYVKGTAKRWTYHVAAAFETRCAKHGRCLWFNTGEHTHPRRSKDKCYRDAEAWSEEEGLEFDASYGSLHNRRADVGDYHVIKEFVKEVEEAEELVV